MLYNYQTPNQYSIPCTPPTPSYMNYMNSRIMHPGVIHPNQIPTQHMMMREGRSRSITRGPFSRTVASRSTTPPPIRSKQRTSNELNKFEYGVNATPDLENRTLSYQQLDGYNQQQVNYRHNTSDIRKLNNPNFPKTPTISGKSNNQLNVNNTELIGQQQNQQQRNGIEPTPTHVAKVNKLKMLSMQNSALGSLTDSLNRGVALGPSRQTSIPPNYYHERRPSASPPNMRNCTTSFNESSSKVLSSYVSRQLEEEVGRLRHLVEIQTKKISSLEQKNAELESEILFLQKYQQLYQDMINTNSTAENNNHNINKNNLHKLDSEDEYEHNTTSDTETDYLKHMTNTEKNVLQKMEPRTAKLQVAEKKSVMFSNIHEFSAESALRKAGIPPGKPAYLYRLPSNPEPVDIQLADFHNSRSSLVRWSKVSSTIYLFGATQVQLRVLRGRLQVRVESCDWGSGNFCPIEKFVSVFEPIERAKMNA
ncbi:hypothetical protein cand_030900 [Cryptosporidium andersoni]|uniref:Uncharacterized protein n=1 Tax=Cryptosporidium andersoni TaxID=117008 RepID=A0A1J4MRN3_9CRYT|nr:hypothetical protein cand_030900 [Cryptosporidium andersoni]